MSEAFISKHVKGKLNVWKDENDEQTYCGDNELGLLIILWLMKQQIDVTKKNIVKIIAESFAKIEDYQILHIVICDDNTFELYVIE